MLCHECLMAVNMVSIHIDGKYTFAEGTIEMWRCPNPNCNRLYITVMTGGRRVNAGILIIEDEKRL